MNSNNFKPNQNSSKATLRLFFLIFFSIGALLTVIITIVYSLEKKDSIDKIMANEKFNLALQKTSIAKIFETIDSDLLFLSSQNELMSLLKTNDSKYKQLIDREYIELSSHKMMYDQIRFIDENGMEICRANFNKGIPESVPASALQSKKNRYYFSNSFKLNQNEIFVSPFDLNIENGAIEKPLKPMIRFGTPAIDHTGKKRGVIILNFLGSNLIHTIQQNARLSEGNIMLVNADGYWLIGLTPEDEWGFMFPDKKDLKFQKTFPETWEGISTKDSVQIYTKKGLFTSTTIYPLAQGIQSSTGTFQAFGKSKKRFSGTQYYWKLISFVPSDVLHSKSNGLFTRLLSMGILLFILSSIPSYLISQGIIRRKRHQLELVHLATFDQLTGLPNRFLFFDRLDQALKQASRYKRQFALLFLDLDGFKQVNDSLGHDAGDELLKQAAERLVNAVRKSDTVARLAGDEFTIILTDIQSKTDPEKFSQKILKDMAAPFIIKQNKVTVTASIGIGLFSVGNETAETLLKKSDTAMYEAKKQGKNTYTVFKDVLS